MSRQPLTDRDIADPYCVGEIEALAYRVHTLELMVGVMAIAATLGALSTLIGLFA